LTLLSFFILSCHAFIFKKKTENLQLTSWSCLQEGFASRFDPTSILPFPCQENVIYRNKVFKEKGRGLRPWLRESIENKNQDASESKLQVNG
jgi:hypothetical protein